jgi:DNA-directed RNA polymerase subunit RPC12/RpoP
MKIKMLECPSCGAPVRSKAEEKALVCEYCGREIWLEEAPPAAVVVESPALAVEYSPASYTVTLVLALVLGVFGAHRFYTGKILSGVIQMLTGGGAYVWWLIDVASILSGSFEDSKGRRLKRPERVNGLAVGFAVYAVSVVVMTTLFGDVSIAYWAALFPALAAGNWESIRKWRAASGR